MPNEEFSFEISLSVLNHLGRNLYRSFMTVLGEAISNSWDADADNVWIYVNRDAGTLIIKDDGIGMDNDSFQNRFLRIGFSKRRGGESSSSNGRPYIGRKGIGKLALLSCADRITVISKTKDTDYIGGVIDNSGLDQAISDDLTPNEYALESWNEELLSPYMVGHEQGTIIYFENFRDGIRNTLDFMRRMIALYFRFSLHDNNFNIYLDGSIITHNDLSGLSDKTDFLWTINEVNDPYVEKNLTVPPLKKDVKNITCESSISGFIASVNKPRDLKVITTEDRVSVDLFVNGRLREKDILKHIPSARLVESYLYGQIHFDALDDEEDRFTSSREGVVADDPLFKSVLEDLRTNVIKVIFSDWDKWRIENREDGDPENDSIPKKERKSRELFNVISEEFGINDEPRVTPQNDDENIISTGDEVAENDSSGLNGKERVNEWVNQLGDDAQFNFSSYAECYISENLIRFLIEDKGIPLSDEAQTVINQWKEKETRSKAKGNISIDIRKLEGDLSYLSMNDLAYLVDQVKNARDAGLSRDADEYKPMRDAMAHTSLLTDEAKARLTAVYQNIKARIKQLLSELDQQI